MDSAVMDSIITEYENQRASNKRERDKRVYEAYELAPEIKKIDMEIARIGSSTLRNILASPDDTGAKEEMKNKFKILKKKKNDLLLKFNIPADYDKLRYKCDMCKDTGYVEGKGRCSCFNQKLIDRLYDASNMRELLKKQNFNLFNMDFYSKNHVKDFKNTPYENMVNTKKFCEEFVDNFEKPSKSLMFYGDTGLGKTYMSSCIGKAVMDKGRTVLYMRSTRLFRMLDDERFGRSKDGTDGLYEVDLLIIDDLGTETYSKNNSSYILDLVSERINRDKKMIINTNYNFEGLEKLYTKRFSSRLLDSFNMMYFYGEDIRKKKLFKN